MPTQLAINDVGTERYPAYVAVNSFGTYIHIAQIWVNDAGLWRLVTPFYDDIQVGDLTTSQYGYNVGGVSPPSAPGGTLYFDPGNLGIYGLPTLNTFLAIWSGPGPGSVDRDLWITITQSSVNQLAFSEILLEDSAGAIRRYTTAGASSYSRSGLGVGVWGWGIGSNHVYTVGDVGGPRRWFCMMP